MRCEVAALPVGGEFTMTWEEAAEACELIDTEARGPDALRRDHRGHP